MASDADRDSYLDDEGEVLSDEATAAEEEYASVKQTRAISWLPEPSRTYRVAKRLLDISVSLFSIILLAPVLVVIAALVKITSKGPVLHRQTRLGLHGKPFVQYTFRSMRVIYDVRTHAEFVRRIIAGGPPERGTGHRLTADPRLTLIGRFLRRTSLDELPQFFNVLVGDMSIVGPRPPIPYEIEFYEDWHMLRLSCKPGITGLWQVRGRNRSTFDQMVQLDIDYIKHPSLSTDLKILLETPYSVLNGE